MPRVVDREARRAELVSAAAAVFAERGVANTAVSDIVKAAGVAQGTFYLYFDSKDDVVLAVVERIGDGMVERIDGARRGAGSSAVDKLPGAAATSPSAGAQPGAADARRVHAPARRTG